VPGSRQRYRRGGVFFKSADRNQSREWYSKHLGLADKGGGAMLPWRERDDPKKEHVTVRTIFPAASHYFDPGPAVLASVLAMSIGYRSTINSDGRANRAIIIMRGSTSEYESGMPRSALPINDSHRMFATKDLVAGCPVPSRRPIRTIG